MAPSMTEEKWVEILRQSAIQRFGEARAKILDPAIQDMARSLAAIARHDLKLEEEPAFFS